MPVYTVTKYEPLPEGVYHCKLDKIEEIDTAYGPKLRLLNRVVGDGPHRDKTVSIFANPNVQFTPKAKIHQLACCYLNTQLAEGEVVDTDDLVGGYCTIWLEVVEGDDGFVNKVNKIRPWDGSDDGKPGSVADIAVEG